MDLYDLIIGLHKIECIECDWAQNPVFMNILAKEGIPMLKEAQRILYLVQQAYNGDLSELEKLAKENKSKEETQHG